MELITSVIQICEVRNQVLATSFSVMGAICIEILLKAEFLVWTKSSLFSSGPMQVCVAVWFEWWMNQNFINSFPSSQILKNGRNFKILTWRHVQQHNMNLKYRTKLNGTRLFVRITFFQNSFFTFQLRWFEMCLFFIFFRIRVLSKKRLFLKEIRTKNNLYKCTKIFFWIIW